MDVEQAILKRRSYRALEEIEVTQGLIDDLASAAQLTPSCFNKQPWRYVFVHKTNTLFRLQECLSPGNHWANSANLIIAVVSKKELDCSVEGRDYYLFDTGMATAILMLRATDLGLVAHPIAGYDEIKAKEVLGIPDDLQLITLIIVGKRSGRNVAVLPDHQQESERTRPARLPLDKFAFKDRYTGTED